MEVSVVVNCFNGAKYLREALDSVYAQTLDDWEIVFWDNASRDETAAIAQSYGPRVRYFRSDTTTTLGQARNLAFAKAQGNFIAILDADDIWLPQKLAKQLPLFDRSSEIGLTFTDCTYFDQDGDQYNLFQLVRPRRGYVFGDLLARNFISTESMIYRKDALKTVTPLFDDRFTNVMDYELSLKVAYRYQLDYVDQVLSKWRMHQESQGNQKSALFPLELQSMIENLQLRHPEIRERFGKELQRYQRSLSYGLALDRWRTGKPGEARQHLSQSLGDPKVLLTYLGTWLVPYPVFLRAKDTYRRSVGGRWRRGIIRHPL